MAEHFDAWKAMRDAAGRLHDDAEMLEALAVFIDFWGMDCYTPPAGVESNVRDLVLAFTYAAKTHEHSAGYVSASEVQTAREEALEEAAALIERDEFDSSVRMIPGEGLRRWLRRQQAAAIRALATPPAEPAEAREKEAGRG